MTLDDEQHRKFLLEVFKQVSFPGTILELAVEVKKAIENAEIAPKVESHDGSH